MIHLLSIVSSSQAAISVLWLCGAAHQDIVVVRTTLMTYLTTFTNLFLMRMFVLAL